MTDATEKTEAPARKPRATATADKRSIYQRILDVAASVGVLEPTKNGGVPFAFRGIDATVAHLSPKLNEHGVFVVPVKAEQLVSQREVINKTGQPTGQVVSKTELVVTYRFYGADGDYLEAQVPAQADDFADRSSAQAMSVALRILLLQTFHIPAFGNEEQASEDTKNARETAADAKIDRARTSAAAPKGVDQAKEMRNAIIAAAANKGWEPDRVNQFAKEVTGLPTEGWWDNPDELNKVLAKINEAK